MAIVFPPRNLGLGEPWGRAVEGEVVRLNNEMSRAGQSQGNLSRHKDAQDTQTARQISQIRDILDQLESNQLRISQTVSTGSWSESVSGNSWGELQEVERPPWASSAIVVAGLDNITNQSSPWWGRIEVIASSSTPVTGDLDKSRDPVRAQVDAGYSIVESNPRIIQFSGSGEEDEDGGDPITPLYIRARGVRQGGTSSRTYTFDAAYAVIWS